MSSYTPDPEFENRFRLPPPRPTAVTVLGILHLAYGGLTLLLGLCSGVLFVAGVQNFTFQPPGPAPANAPFPTDLGARQQKFLEQAIPFHYAVQLAQIGAWVVLSTLLVAAGFELLAMRRRGRRLSLLYAVGSIAYQLAGFIYTAVFMLPAMTDFYRQLELEFPRAAPMFGVSRMALWVGLLFVPVGLAYPIVVLVLLTRRSVRAAFEGPAGPRILSDTDAPQDSRDFPPDAITR